MSSNGDAATNAHEIRMVGMSRSGNHAIINWILAQTPGRYCHLNCVEPKTNPFDSARPARDRSWRANYAFDLEAERAGVLSRKDLLLYNYEDCFLGSVGSPQFDRAREHFVGPSIRRTDLLLLRDPYNLFASRRRIESPVADRVALRIWKQHARAALSGSRHLGSDLLCILYNRWVCDRDYRAAIARRLGLPFTDAGRNRVAAAGGGSSFDAMRFDGEAERMDVFNRWRRAFGEEGCDLFDDEVAALTERVFGDLSAEAMQPLREAADRLVPGQAASTLRVAA